MAPATNRLFLHLALKAFNSLSPEATALSSLGLVSAELLLLLAAALAAALGSALACWSSCLSSSLSEPA
eukprot:7909970-Lingulodinium_polyedra.AAC.1